MHLYGINSGGAISLVADTPKTAWQWVTPTSRRSKLVEIGVSFRSVTASDPGVLVELRLQSTAGTSSAATLTLIDQADPVALGSGRNAVTVEPTDVSLLVPGPWQVTPVGGLFVYDWKQGLEIVLPVSARIALRLTSPGVAQANVYAYGSVQE